MELIVTSKNPHDISPDELKDLAAQIRAEDPALQVRTQVREERGYGVTPYEVVQVIADLGGAAAALGGVGKALQVSVRWTQSRWQRDRLDHPQRDPRPRTLQLIDGPTGRVRRSVTIDMPDGKPTEDEVNQ